MCIYVQFINRFKYEVKSHACRGIQVAIREFDISYKSIQQRFGDIDEIRQCYVDAVNVKTNWGYKQLIRELEEILEDCR
ncbi:hypothetical protein [Photobacterium leiognathi]|uniref:Uncharacterized protein n=1 Tax=Photobacterium leiognathi subsp. mandapamensis TaxID=48408 RepID=A0A2T3KPI1_PHOLD|nr:hypothetical protein [Photobacterium leiognathi]PSV05933.1 hypothetical protein C0W93_21025 [Photobacterium leiognathi subsp. mandapamensis]